MLKFGSIHLFKGGVQHKATKVVLHEQFDLHILDHDIGLVSIHPAKLKYGYFIRPVKVASRLKLMEYDWITIYGWGAVSDDKSFSELLQTATLPSIPRKMCQKLLKGILPRNTFCLGYVDGHLDACMGDSGGPAMLWGLQVGIISFGEGCALPLKPGVYTDLTRYINWIINKQKTEL